MTVGISINQNYMIQNNFQQIKEVNLQLRIV